MSLADTSKRGAALNWRLAVKGTHSASRFREAFNCRRAFSSGMFMAASSSISLRRGCAKALIRVAIIVPPGVQHPAGICLGPEHRLSFVGRRGASRWPDGVRPHRFHQELPDGPELHEG